MLRRFIFSGLAFACAIGAGTALQMSAVADTAPPSTGSDAAPPSTTAAQTGSPVESKDLFAKIETLVQKYYPKAKITLLDTKMHFEEKCSVQSGYYTSAANKSRPEAGGIMGDILVEPGDHLGTHQPTLHSHVSYTTMVISPYSKVQNKHLMVHLYYPPDVDPQFKDRFVALVRNFSEKHAAKVAAATTAAQEAAQKAAAEKATQEKAAQKEADDRAAAKEKSEQVSKDHEATFGAATLSETKFPEGRFKVKFPGKYNTLYAEMLGQRMVRYSAPTANGTMNVSYMIMPQAPTAAASDALSNQVTEATIKAMNGVPVGKAGVDTLNGYPGAQTYVNIKDKSDYGGVLTVYAGGNYVYVIDSVGKKSWLRSDAVSQFMTSFVCWGQNVDPNAVQYWYGPGGYQYWADAQGIQHWWDARHWEHWRDRDGREHWYDGSHHEHW